MACREAGRGCSLSLVAGVVPEVPRALAGRYRLVRLLARGGMAEVWEGRDEVLSRPVAVKILLSHLANDPFLRERFRREAVTAARLVHPGIVAIFDAGVEVLGQDGTSTGAVLATAWSTDEADGLERAWPEQPSTAFIVMELVPGETLRDLIVRSGPLPPELAVAVTSQVTEALAYAHAQGLVHRDIKPANVLLGTEGRDLARVKVADFGIAKAAATAHLDLTATGTLLGTPKYLSPEQVQGQEPDARADLYSLGVVLFEMLAGQAPFKASTEMATALAHVQQAPPPLRQLRPGLPPSLYELVEALLVKDPSRRVPSALVLGGALTSVRRQMGLPGTDAGSYVRLPSGTAPPEPARTGASAGAGRAEGPSRTSPTGPGPAPTGGGRTGSGGRAGTVNLGGAGTQREVPVPNYAATGTVAMGSATEVALAAQGASPSVVAAPPASAGAHAGPARAKARPRHRTGRAASILVGCLALAGLLVLAELLSSSGGRPGAASGTSGGGPGPATAGPVRIVAVHELTQNGILPNDNLADLSHVLTGDSPVWTGDVYKSADFGNSGGFGLVLQLSGAHALHELVVETTMSGWSARSYVSAAPLLAGCSSGSYSSSCIAPVSAWGAATSSASNLTGSHTFSLGGRRGAWVLFWMLDPGPALQAEVTKLSVS